MPQLNEILNNRVKKFVKRSYRPWDLSGDLDIHQEKTIPAAATEEDNNANTAKKPDTIQTQINHEIDTNYTQIERNAKDSKFTHSAIQPKIQTIHENSAPKTEHKPNTNNTQFNHDLNTEIDTKPNTNKTHKNDAKTKHFKTGHKSTTKSNTVIQKNSTHIAHKLDTNISFASLSGIQRDLVVLIFNHCKIAKQDATNEMSVSYIAASLNIRAGSVKNSVARLEQKNFILRLEYKIGRGGWSRYKLSDALYSELLYLDKMHKLDTNQAQITHKQNTKLDTEIDTMSSSSSSLDQTTTITNKSEKNSLPIEWQQIDFELLEKIRFHKGHVDQLFKHGLELQPVQESIYHFSFDLTVNNKGKDIKTDPLGFFMGIMKRSGYYAAPENYESPQEQGRRLFLEQEAKKAQKKLQAEKELMMSYFELWVNQFTEQEKIDLVGKTELGPNRTMLTTEHKLVMHYKNTIWPEQYKKMVAGGS